MKAIVNENKIIVGKVANIIVKKDKIFFMCKLYKCERDYLRFFRPHEVVSEDYVLVDNLADCQPLYPIGKGFPFLFVMKHNISFSSY